MKNLSRVLAVATVACVGSASAKGCPDFVKTTGNILQKNAILMTGSALLDSKFDKHDHAKKALLGTTLHSLDVLAQHKVTSSQDFAHRVFVDYGIRRTADAIGLDGYRDALLKKCDVLPEGMIRDNVQPAVEGAAAIFTHPEFLTQLAMEYVIPQIVAAVTQKSGN